VVSICLAIFCADTVMGMITATISLYAESLGASLTLIGSLGSILNLTILLASVPIGRLSDRIGPRQIIMGGMMTFALTGLLLAMAPAAWFLLVARIINGLAMIATFPVGFVYASEVAYPEERGFVYGLYATSMGAGFTVGPLLAGVMAEGFGYPAAYTLAAGVSMLGAGIAWWGLAQPVPIPPIGSPPGAKERGGMVSRRHPALLAAALANATHVLVFGGVVASFVPLYASGIGMSIEAVGSMLAIRALMSTVARLPTGVVSGWLPSRVLMVGAMVGDIIALLGMILLATPQGLTVALAVEGLAFGIFAVAGQAFVTGAVRPEERGEAMGIYWAAGSLGTTMSPLALGLVAQSWGLVSTFHVTTALVIIGLAVFLLLVQWQRAPRAE
jgi:MFS family permease